jgi:DNA topoisomerase-3
MPYTLLLPQSLLFTNGIVQGGDHLNLEWERGRVFDQDVGQVFAAAVKDGGSLRVQSISTKEDRKPRPPGLNTVELLKVASSALNIGPAQAMAVRGSAVLSTLLSFSCYLSGSSPYR